MLSFDDFNRLAAEGYSHIPVFRQRLADTDTPLAVYARLRSQGAAYLFESVQGGERWGRYSMIGIGSGTQLEYHHQQLTLREGSSQTTQACSDPFEAIEDFLRRFRVPTSGVIPDLPGFQGGLVGYFGYDTIRVIERHLRDSQPQRDDLAMPDIWLMLSQTVVVFDTLSDTVSLIVLASTVEPESFARANAELDRLEQLLAQPLQLEAKTHSPPEFQSVTGEQAFKDSVERVKEYIRAGDVMQVVPSQRMTSAFDGDPLSVYRALRHLNPSPYLFLLQGETLAGNESFALVGSSPEILSRLEAGVVTVRPIAGTRPRGKTLEEDQRLARELLADQKEIAEHVMLIDLGRNDVGRVSQTGQVRVTEKMTIERYSHVMHIVSNVEGKVKPGQTALDVFRATFPAGTLSGAPKIRAMEIIDEVEPVKRGVFGGAVGYLGWHGEMDTAIAIRTGVIRRGKIHVQAGAGVVADSQADSEWNETLIKARAVMRAVEMSAQALKL